ncbi:Uncharacterised protein [Candidatus Gugararchaeum adminiculabundum]|nr:Uncharacterised protein [Candidatus Gugararchaeum adminiculabundum]
MPKSTFKFPDLSVEGSFTCRIACSHILVEIFDCLEEENRRDDDIFRITHHIIDTVILSYILKEGLGLTYSLDYCKKSDDQIRMAHPDKAPSLVDKNINLQKFCNEVSKIIGLNHELRWAVRDFNTALIDREECPLLFYRAVETCARLVTKNYGELGEEGWDNFYLSTNTNRADMRTLRDFHGAHRHGIHKAFGSEEHLKMMTEAKFFILKTIDFVLKKEGKEMLFESSP